VGKFRLSRAFFRNRFILLADYRNPPQPDRQLQDARKHGETQKVKRLDIDFVHKSFHEHGYEQVKID